ncbi:unnamed protein product [Calicophoron daubneyi]|uniref:Uncharacterized protein n=1 Tax=Calicophoron daubneyi TaxID=300641 RepID=A0AAV2TFB0_CALDB
MTYNTEFQTRFNLAKFLLDYVDFNECADRENRIKNGLVRKLGDFQKLAWAADVCQGKLEPRMVPIRKTCNVREDTEYLYITHELARMLEEFYRGRVKEESKGTTEDKGEKLIGKAKCAPKRKHFISKLSKEFSALVRDESFRVVMRQAEGMSEVLGIMWRPTRPVESVGQYAIAKHASIHYILSTHAILPSSECFTPEDIQRIMHLPMEWIGALPRQEDTRCITKFIARFADLFARKPVKATEDMEDPLDRHARKCGQRVFMDIIHYACDGTMPPKPVSQLRRGLLTDHMIFGFKVQDIYESIRRPPLDWEDQLSRHDVKIVDMPVVEASSEVNEHRFRRPVKDHCRQQVHSLFVPVDESSVQREASMAMTAMTAMAKKDASRLFKYQKSRALKRAAQVMNYPFMHDLRQKQVEDTPAQLVREENYFRNIVQNLPHRSYGLENLGLINAKVLAGRKPPRFNASWLIDPTEKDDANKKPYIWDPDRRIHREYAIRSARLPSIVPSSGAQRNGPSGLMKSKRHTLESFDNDEGPPSQAFSDGVTGVSVQEADRKLGNRLAHLPQQTNFVSAQKRNLPNGASAVASKTGSSLNNPNSWLRTSPSSNYSDELNFPRTGSRARKCLFPPIPKNKRYF